MDLIILDVDVTHTILSSLILLDVVVATAVTSLAAVAIAVTAAVVLVQQTGLPSY